MSSNNEANLRAAPVLNDDKNTYFIKTFISTILGGYRFSNEDDNIEITLPMHFIQIVIYLIFPLIAFIIGMIGNIENYVTFVVIFIVVKNMNKLG